MNPPKERYTRLTIEQSMVKTTWEIPYEDIDLSDMINTFFTLCCLLGFSQEMVYRVAEEYLKECNGQYKYSNK